MQEKSPDMKKIYHLSTCDTCKRILKEVEAPASFELQDIKEKALTGKELDKMKDLEGSYEALFNKRAKLYRERGLNKEDLSEEQYRELILEHYTFLKRPVIINEDEIFTGNSKKTVGAAKKSIHE